MNNKLISLARLATFWTQVKNYIDTALNNKVSKEEGKGLSANDLTNALKANYDAAYTHSNNGDVHVTTAQKAAWDAKADPDHNHTGTYAPAEHSHAYSALSGLPTIPTMVSQLTDAGNYALKSDLASVYKYKGSVAAVANLPTGAADGDVYNVEADGMNYAWNGTAWDALGSSVTIEVATDAEINALFN